MVHGSRKCTSQTTCHSVTQMVNTSLCRCQVLKHHPAHASHFSGVGIAMTVHSKCLTALHGCHAA